MPASQPIDTDFVLLESADGYTFSVPRRIANASATLRSMLDEDSAFQEAKEGTVRLQHR